MTRTNLQPRAALAGIFLAAFALLAAACGSSTTETAPADSTDESGEMEDMEDMSDGDGHGDDHGDDHGGDKEEGDDHGGEHDHGVATVDVPAEGAPEISIDVAQSDDGVVVEVDLANFVLTDPDVAEEYVEGEGHMHAYVDGVKVGRFYETTINLDALPVGEHLIEVEVNASDHAALAIDGEPIRASATITVAEGDAAPAVTAEHVVALSYAAGEISGDTGTIEVEQGSMVEVRVTSDVAEHVHVHGYDLFGDLTPGEELVMQFSAEIPGVFEVELEDSGTLLFDLQVR